METDIIGKALENYYFHKKNLPIIIHSPNFDEDEIKPSWYFRNFEKMPELEKNALEKCRGRILDVGAGAGSHSLYLQKAGKNVTAMDISPGACNVMTARGVRNVIHQNIYHLSSEKFDTILMLMNGIGLCSTIEGLEIFLSKLEGILLAGGELIFDSTNLIYLYSEEEQKLRKEEEQKYYGEIEFRMEYLGNLSEPFSWLYIDFKELSKTAAKFNFKSEILFEGSNLHYLARIFR